MSVRTKIAIALLLILVVLGSLIAGTQLFITVHEDGATAINVAGQQRLHVQQMQTEVYRIEDGQLDRRDDLAELVRTYDRTLTDLETGNASRGIPPAPPDAAAQLETVRTHWAQLRTQLGVVRTAPPTSRTFQAAVAAIEDRADTLVAETHRAVVLMEETHESHIRNLQIFLGAMLLLGAGVLVTTGVGLYRGIVQPLVALTDDSQRIAAGELDHEIETRPAADEVGRMTRSVEEMREQLTDALEDVRSFEHAVEHAGLAIMLTDEAGEIQYVNPAFERITGYEAAEAIGRTPRLLKSGEHDEAFYEDLWSTTLGGDIWHGEVVDQRASGELFTADQTIAPITDDDGEVTGMVSILRDVTDRKQNVQYRKALERVIRHNLRNELNVVDGAARRLLDEPTDEARREAVDQILRSSAELLDLTETSQAISSLLDQPKHGLDLDVIIEHVRAHCQHAHPDADLVTTGQIPAGITVDSRIEPAIIELCDNAVSHADQAPPAVTLRVEPQGARHGWIDIAIVDEGPGIPEEERAVLEGEEETPLQHGTGLGLWLVNLAVTAIGGTLSFEDNEPRGTVVTISLPIMGESTAEPEPDNRITNDDTAN